MKAFKKIIIIGSIIALSGCADDGYSARTNSTLTDGAVGAGGGAIISAVTGGSAATGALIGGAGGLLFGTMR